ncbi:MAG: SRPBCC family protein [Dehalococcoidia bacterium]
MAHFSVQIRIDAPKERVWQVLADLGGIYKWNPGVSRSYSTSKNSQGDGATRHCNLQKEGDYLKERAMDWREGEGYKIDVYESNLPLSRNIVEFSIEADGDGTIVKVTPHYALKYGLLGSLMNRLLVQRQFKKGMADLLAGLKYHVETGELVGDRVPTRAAVA